MSIFIPLYAPKTKILLPEVAIISNEDEDLLDFMWFFDIANYVHRSWSIKLHRVILDRVLVGELTKTDFVDHRDTNFFNNQRNNLRRATRSQNGGNRKAYKNSSSGIKGISFHKTSGKWQAKLQIDKRMIWLGLHETQEKAKAAYDEASKIYFKEFARSK